MKLKYAIVAPTLEYSSAGIVGLHLLTVHLKQLGFGSRVIVPTTGYHSPPADDEIVVYPDCYSGNMFNHDKVVRYLMMFAGYFGQDKDFPEDEYMYYYSPEFCLNNRNPENVLTIPMLNEDKFKFYDGERYGTCYLAIKYQDYFGLQPRILDFNLPFDCIRIDKVMDLGILFSKVKRMFTFDNSLINLEAAMAGVDVVYCYNEKFEKRFEYGTYFDYSDVRGSYAKMKNIYQCKQLPDFINRTQYRFK